MTDDIICDQRRTLLDDFWKLNKHAKYLDFHRKIFQQQDIGVAESIDDVISARYLTPRGGHPVPFHP
jgi:hypothetical protein